MRKCFFAYEDYSFQIEGSSHIKQFHIVINFFICGSCQLLCIISGFWKVSGCAYLHRGNFKIQARDIVLWSAIYASVYFLFLDKPYGILKMFTFLTIPILSKYNGKRGEWKGMKWLFYVYYPAHLFVIGIVRILLHGNVSTIKLIIRCTSYAHDWEFTHSSQ